MSLCTKFMNQLRLYLAKKIHLPVLTTQSAIFGLVEVQGQNHLLFNHMLLIFKYNINNSRVKNNLNFQSIKYVIPGIKCVEEAIGNDDINKK